MSLKSWTSEFYPITARTFNGDLRTRENWIAAIKHSIQKWTGLLRENKEKHGVTGHRTIINQVDTSREFQSEYLSINDSSCSICHVANRNEDKEVAMLGMIVPDCEMCPLYVVLGNSRCDDNSDRPSPYGWYLDHKDDPSPMIKELRKTLEFVEQGGEWDGCAPDNQIG